MEGLKKLDHIAYVRFASVYREFADIGDLKQTVDNLAAGVRATPSNQLSLLPSKAMNSLIARHQNSKIKRQNDKAKVKSETL
jgi:hypothetical protein